MCGRVVVDVVVVIFFVECGGDEAVEPFVKCGGVFFSECGGDEAVEPFVKCGGVLLVNVVVIEAIEPFLKSLQVPHEALEIAKMSVNFR